MRISIFKTATLVLFVLTASLTAQDAVLPERLARAKYAIVAILGEKGELDFGYRLSAPQEDRQARDSVEQTLRKWKRYTVTMHPEQAELLFVVRTGRSGSVYLRTGPPLDAQGGLSVGKTSPRQADTARDSSRGVTIGGDIAPPDDFLEVYAIEDGRQGMRLWRGLKKGGLAGSDPALLVDYRKRVDELARKLGL